jgi:hypothetical protein
MQSHTRMYICLKPRVVTVRTEKKSTAHKVLACRSINVSQLSDVRSGLGSIPGSAVYGVGAYGRVVR